MNIEYKQLQKNKNNIENLHKLTININLNL